MALTARIKDIATVRVRYGYPRIHVLLRRVGFAVNRKRVYRLYSLQGLNLRSKMPHRKRAVVSRGQRLVASRPNDIWAMDFMHERLADGTKIRLLTIVDLFSRECVALALPDHSNHSMWYELLIMHAISAASHLRFAVIMEPSSLRSLWINGRFGGT